MIPFSTFPTSAAPTQIPLPLKLPAFPKSIMRKKLLALLMCATMVLGTGVTAFAYNNDDIDAADKIVKQYDQFKGEFNDGAFGKTTDKDVTFDTTYVKADKSISYTYAFTAADSNSFVKVGPSTDEAKAAKINGKALVKTNNVIGDAVVTGTSINKSVTVNDVLSLNDGITTNYYYVASVGEATEGATLVVTTPGLKNAYLVKYNPTLATGKLINGKAADFATTSAAFGIDKDGYIPAAATTATMKLYSTLSDGYYVAVSDASKSKVSIAEALSKGTISKNAVAVNMQFYKTIPAGSKDANEYGFKELISVNASREDTNVSLKADWLSRTNLKKADGVDVYLVDPNVTITTEYFQKLNDVFKVATVSDGQFTADYLVSGTYIFDVATDASNNDGVSDNTTTAAAAAANNSASPKTGDVAPIAALAVVMMGACGAMVVASKKRA